MNNSRSLRLWDMDARQAEELKRAIQETMQPEYEWYEQWLPCFPVITAARRRYGQVYYLQEYLLSAAAGAAIPAVLPVRMAQPSAGALKVVYDFYGCHYRIYDRPSRGVAKKGVKS